MHCRHCKGDDHWSTTCPYKDFMQTEEEAPDTERAGREAGTVPGGRYVPPMRSGMDRQTDRRSDENTCRVTNLPQDMDESELREIFTKIGRCTRVFIARDKITNLPKGFAFVTYENREDAARAIRKMGLLTILRKQRAREREMRILILGLVRDFTYPKNQVLEKPIFSGQRRKNDNYEEIYGPVHRPNRAYTRLQHKDGRVQGVCSESVGRRRSKESALLLAELFRTDGRFDLGRRFGG
ncbi:hypothetical protein WR25_00655 isoform B [Diploscapter pachys]|uniref:RRM domain-containing protein n=1 Tax=Diploscapter pachys TaxID=2018661 RepID=A0A2A2JIY6_9BILA|nr:hypothetical protein WR25_00655 isoform B [Diploscapter pachys]